jgi:hypothetical protein
MARTERITARMTPEQRALTAVGAGLVGQSISAFRHDRPPPRRESRLALLTYGSTRSTVLARSIARSKDITAPTPVASAHATR